MIRNIAKFALIGLAIVVAGIVVLYGMQYFRYRTSPEYQVEQDLKNLEKAYAEDSFGCETPEETLALFIDALKKEDTELAAKYFVLDKQEEWREDLEKIKEKGLMGDMIKDLEREKYKYSVSDSQVGFDVANDQKEAILSISLGKSSNRKWKILDL